MQINVSGHHVDITDSIREAVNTRFEKVASHFPDLDTISVILTVERHEQRVEADTQYLGDRVAIKAADNDLYVAINSAGKKLSAALDHRKGVTKSFKKESSM